MFDFFSFRNKADHDRLATLKAVTLWMKELPLGDIYAAHEKVVKALIEFNGKQAPFTRERLEVLMYLDSNAREMQHALCDQYLRNPRMSKVIESRLWNAVHAFYWEVTRGYHAFIMDYVANPGSSQIKAQLPLITTRAMHDFARLFKWHAFRYEKVESRLWKRFHNLYRFAEYEKFEHLPQKLHAASETETTVAEEFVHALMLETLNTGSFYPRQIELLDGWLVAWARKMLPEREFDADRHVFYTNLMEGAAAKRVRKAAEDKNCRYWGTSELISHIENLRARLLNGEAPALIGLSEDCRLPGCLDFLDDIARLWAPTVQRIQRKHERSRVMKMIEVVHGFNEICAEVKHDNDEILPMQGGEQNAEVTYEEMLDVKLYGFVTQRTLEKIKSINKAEQPTQALRLPTHERWVMENESAGGYGATIDELANDWVRLGRIVGLKPERVTHWRIGVVRRMNKLSAGQHYVGIEILSDTPVTVMLKPHQAKPASGYKINGIDAVDVLLPVPGIYLTGGDDERNLGSLIIDSTEFSIGRQLELTASNKLYQIRLKDVLERGEDWLRCSFEVMTKSGDAA